jgi:hypothetical protein
MTKFNQVRSFLLRVFFLALPQFSLFCGVKAQQKNKLLYSLDFKTNKEGLNEGLVFNGFQPGVAYSHIMQNKSNCFQFDTYLGLGVLFRGGMQAVNFSLTPLSLSYLHKLAKSDRKTFEIGLNFKSSYNLNLYPYLNSGHSFWVSEVGLSGIFKYQFTIKNKTASLYFSNSLLGFTSRPSDKQDPYFYSFKFKDFINNSNSDFKLGSFNKYNHTIIQFEYNLNKKHTVGICTDLLQINYQPEFKQLSYGIKYAKLF